MKKQILYSNGINKIGKNLIDLFANKYNIQLTKYILTKKDLLKNKNFKEFVTRIIISTDTPKKAEAKMSLIQEMDNARQNKSELWNQISEEIGSILSEINIKTSLESIVLAKNFGVENYNLNDFLTLYSDLLPKLINAKEKYNLDIEKMKIDRKFIGDDNHLRLKDESGHIFKFDSKTGELISFGADNQTNNLKARTISKSQLTTNLDGYATPRCQLLPYSNVFCEDMDILIKKDTGEEISHDKYMKSKIQGEYEIYSVNPNGKRFLTGLAEIDENGGKYVEKTLTSLDGTKTQTVYADDKKGNVFNFYQIKDKDGKILYESTKKKKNYFRKSLSDI